MDWSIDFKRAKAAIEGLEKLRRNKESTTLDVVDDDDDETERLRLQREILLSNPVGRHLLENQLKNVFSKEDGSFIYDPRSLDNLPVLKKDSHDNDNNNNNSEHNDDDDDDDVQHVVVLLSGALNPIHRAHVKAVLLGAKAVEDQFGIPGKTTSWNSSSHHHHHHKSEKKKSSSSSSSKTKPQKTHQHHHHHPYNEDGKSFSSAALSPGRVKVIGCALVPSSDGYVLSKLGKGNALTCEMRCKFTDAACIQETKEYLNKVEKYCVDVMNKVQAMMVTEMERTEEETGNNDDDNDKNAKAMLIHQKVLQQTQDQLEHFFPLICLPYNQASANWCCLLLEKELKDHYNGTNDDDEDEEEEESSNKNKNNKHTKKKKKKIHHFKALRLYGSDFCMKYRSYRDMICIERHDSEKSGAYVKSIVQEGKLVGENFIFVSQDPNRDVFGGNSNCSSTAIRQALATAATVSKIDTTTSKLNKKKNSNSNNDDDDKEEEENEVVDPRQILSPMLHTEVMETMIRLTELKMCAERKATEEQLKKEQMIAFHKNKKEEGR